MPSMLFIITCMAVAIAGGAVAAKLAGVDLMKGVLVAGAAALAALVAAFLPGMDRTLAMSMGGLIAAGIAGSSLGLTAAGTAPILIGTAAPPLLAMFVLEMG